MGLIIVKLLTDEVNQECTNFCSGDGNMAMELSHGRLLVTGKNRPSDM